MKLHELPQKPKNHRRVGRGNASGHGTTAGRGTKGQRSRTSSGNIPIGFEGGQMPLKQRIPKKKGFRNYYKKEYAIVNIQTLAQKYSAGSIIDLKSLLEKGLIKKAGLVKILGDGEIDKKIEVWADAFSKSAKEKIEKVGGKANLGKFKSINKTDKVSIKKEPKVAAKKAIKKAK